MQIVVDGLAYEKRTSRGVARVFTEFLPRVCSLADDVEVSVVTTRSIQQDLPRPVHERIKYYKTTNIHRLFQGRYLADIKSGVRSRIVSRGVRRLSKQLIWHSSYFTLPYRWQGKNVLTVHDMIYELYPALLSHPLDDWFRTQKRKCVEAADAIICVSASTAKDLHRFYDFAKQKPTYIIHSASSGVFHQVKEDQLINYSPPIKKRFMFYVGSRGYYKGFDQLLRAYASWKMKEDIDLIVVGGHWSKDEDVLIKDLKLGNNIHLLSNISDQELNYLYNAALFFVYPSQYEGFGLPLVEAMQAGCPIVASKIPSTVEVAGDVAIYFEVGNVDEFLAALTKAAEEGRDSKKVSLGFERSLNFSWDTCAEKTLGVYTDLVS